MPNVSLLLRCLIVLAFCLDGSAMAWQKSAMAVSAVQHVHAASDMREGAVHGSDDVAAMDCDNSSMASGSDATHEGCDCSDAGCKCACGFLTLALARGVSIAEKDWIGFVPTSGHLTNVEQGTSSSVFRPPIG
ncbi:MAG: CopL family metal-binding regulatory protein [Lysobacter sp.]